MTETSIKYWSRGRSKSWEKLNQEFEEGSAVLFNCQGFFLFFLQEICSLVKPQCEKKTKQKETKKHPAKGCKELFLVSFIPGWSKMNQRIQSLHREEHRAILAAVKSGLVLGFIGKDRVKRVRKRRPLRVFNSLADTANTLSSPNTTDSAALLNSWEEIKLRGEKKISSSPDAEDGCEQRLSRLQCQSVSRVIYKPPLCPVFMHFELEWKNTTGLRCFVATFQALQEAVTGNKRKTGSVSCVCCRRYLSVSCQTTAAAWTDRGRDASHSLFMPCAHLVWWFSWKKKKKPCEEFPTVKATRCAHAHWAGRNYD